MIPRRAWLVLLLACGDSALAPRGRGPAADPPSPECKVDEDCVLLPTITCCGECPPAPPFEAAPRWVLDGMLVESETTCAAKTAPCPPLRCDPIPQGCVARPVCSSGTCSFVATGCGLPTS